MRSKVIGALAIGVALVSWASICLSLKGGLGPRIPSAPHKAIGSVMAQQALALLQPGGQITVITRDTRNFKNPASDFQMAALLKAARQAHTPIRQIRALQVDPLRPVEVPAADFIALLRNTPKGSVIVSFMGPPPLLTPSQLAKLGDSKPSVVAFCTGTLPELVNLRALLEQGLLQSAVVDRPAPTLASRPSDQRAGFDQSFLVITPTNLAELPPRFAGNP